MGAAYAAVDEALAAFGEPRARAAREAGGKNGRSAARFLDDHAAITMRMLVGRILCLVGAAVLAYDFAVGLPDTWMRAVSVALTALLYATTVGIATTLATRRASGIALPLLRYFWPIEMIVMPVAAPLVWASSLIDRLYPPRPEDDPERVTETVVEHLIEQGEELGSIDEEQAELLKSVLEFQDTVARQIMVPRTNMVAVDVETPLEDIVKLIMEKGHSRYPIYRENIDQLVGILYAKDLFRALYEGDAKQGRLEDLIRKPVIFIEESQKISYVLRQMQARRVHLAIVVDEFHGTSGMVTLEDIIEEIVGEIRDEHDLEEAPVRQIAPGRYLANADVSVHDLAQITGLQLPEDSGDYESLGGMIVDLAGRVPQSGDAVEVGGHALIVRAADERHVTRVEVVLRKEAAPAAE